MTRSLPHGHYRLPCFFLLGFGVGEMLTGGDAKKGPSPPSENEQLLNNGATPEHPASFVGEGFTVAAPSTITVGAVR